MLTKFRICYPQGSLISELVTIDRGQYIVKALAIAENITLATSFAAASTIEEAEDKAKQRVLESLILEPSETPTVSQEIVDDKNKSAATKPLTQAVSSQPESPELSPLVSPSVAISPSDNGVSPSSEPTEKGNEDLVTPSEPAIAYSEESSVFESDSSIPQLELDSTPVTSVSVPETNTAAEPDSVSTPTVEPTPVNDVVEVDFNEIIDQSNVELKRLGWTKEQGVDFLLKTYGKRSRLHLTDKELLEFLRYLQSEPTP